MSSDAANVFIASCSPDDFDRTVRSSVDLSEFSDRPAALSERESARFWGAPEGTNNEAYFEKMEEGDLVLFYHGDEYVGAGWIGTTFEDESGWANDTFWENGQSNLVYTIEDFTPVSVPKSAVNKIFDYSAGYNPGRLLRVASERVTNRPEAIKLAVERYGQNS